MGFHRSLRPPLIEFIAKQRMLFVATAPSDGGRINLSPKGYQSLAVLDASRLLYLDFAGSGNETANHIADNRRVTFMWCSFEEKPLILRVYGSGRRIEKGSPDFARLAREHFPRLEPAGTRRLIEVAIEAVQTSCGYGVPRYDLLAEREKLAEWTAKHVAAGTLEEYIVKNAGRAEEKFPLASTPLPL